MAIINLAIGISCIYLGFMYDNKVLGAFGVFSLVIAFILATTT